jgi:hypothetical protein
VVPVDRLARPIFALALTGLGVLSGCSGPSDQASQPGSAAPSDSASPAATSFNRLGYRFAVPKDWQAQEGYLDWETLNSIPSPGTPAFDTFSGPLDPEVWIVIGKRPVRDSASLDQWLDQMRAAHLLTYEECDTVEDQRNTTLDGERAELVGLGLGGCPSEGPEAAEVQVRARHGDDGWVVTCFAEGASDLPEFEAQCEGWLGTYEFAT